MEAGSRREQQSSAGEESARRGACRGIVPVKKLQKYHIVVPTYLVCTRGFGSGKYLIAIVNRFSARCGTGYTRAGPCLGE